jgi:signal transduction histidine kinase
MRPSPAALAVAAALSAYAVGEAVVASASGAWFAVALALTVPMAWHRLRPVAVTAWTLAGLAAVAAVGGAGFDSVLPLPLSVVLAYTAGREAPTGRIAALGALTIGAAFAVTFALTSPAENSAGADLVALVVVVGGAAGAGHLMRVRHGETVQLQTLTTRLAAEQEARARAAVVAERARVARELHDIVAHSVSLIAVQAAAADELLGRDEARARESVRAVQDTARGALTEIRRLLSVLREDAAEPGLAPPSGLDGVQQLVDQARASGLPVNLREEGEPATLPAGLDLSAYRIVQEALTNARKHAPGSPAEVLVRHGDGELLLEVVNPSPADGAPGDGYGLAGMRERVRIYGGTLEAGRAGGRFVVRARLPVGPAA